MARIEIIPLSVLNKWPSWNPWKVEEELAALADSKVKMKKKMEAFKVNSSREEQRLKEELYARE